MRIESETEKKSFVFSSFCMIVASQSLIIFFAPLLSLSLIIASACVAASRDRARGVSILTVSAPSHFPLSHPRPSRLRSVSHANLSGVV